MFKANTDAQHLAKLRDYYARVGVLPSYSGVSEVVGFRTKAAAVKLAQRLSSSGYLKIASNRKLAPGDKFFERVLAATVRAGAPEIDSDVTAEVVTIDRFLIDNPSDTVLVRVRGDSMRDAGIRDGDIVVVERVSTAQRGDFVIALLEGEFTLKELDYDGHQVVLRPHNAQFQPIRAPDDVEIFGVVAGMFRRYPRRRIPKSSSKKT